MQNLPIELLERILIKAVLIRVDAVWEQARYTVTPDHYVELASVWSEWRLRLCGSWVSTVLRRELHRINPMEKYADSPRFISSIRAPHPSWGLALLGDEIFSSSIFSPDLVAFSCTTFEKLRTMRLSGVSAPRDLAACPLNNCLYLVEGIGYGGYDACQTGGSVVRVNRLGEQIKQWMVGGPDASDDALVDEAYNLSVTRTGSVLVAFARSLREYSCDGEMLQRFALPEGADMSWHALQLNIGDFLVTQGWSDSTHHRLYYLSSSGNVTLSSVDEPESLVVPAEEKLNEPVHSVLDRDGCVLTADSGNHRVVLLSPRLTFLREIVSQSMQEELISPYRVVLDSALGRLFVSSNNSNIFVYHVFK